MKMEAPPPRADQAKEKISRLKDAHVYVCVYGYMDICVCVFMCICMYYVWYMYLCVYVCIMCVYVFGCMYVKSLEHH